ncbi:hypothetical protein BK704_28895 [[Bacillus thuringiensis] serovar konkukian]|nr:hypothetical protein [Bacillus thuringiensis]MED1300227.1 hypothetical protein [Bacillus pacificus]OUA94873.1 hypothetical protein BK704_28895 [[Bacillus thuringiensis] serovar konkukian]
MMKNHIKKTIRKTVVGFALLSGIVMVGVNPASATILKDSNGNSIVAGQEYYMQPYEFPGQGLAYEVWSTNHWTKLGSGSGETVTFEQSGIAVRMKTALYELVDAGRFDLPVMHSLYLGISSQADGVKLNINNSLENTQWWIPTEPSGNMNSDFAARNYFAFKNADSNKFMSYTDASGWLYANKSNMDSKTMWRLVPR